MKISNKVLVSGGAFLGILILAFVITVRVGFDRLVKQAGDGSTYTYNYQYKP
ncbi:MAG: hypothetical protein WC129_04360 [Sphaerochaetaceae bacterium]|jgi:hypothetical protein|nr:hypothetical protein [Sphaerochaetaceae bacterium]MDX9808967.1 hypothetical protein [Sphaerochaetaceae bacterium]NLV83636.1 hypothetical protein [Spirochaetales bacterium]